MDDHAQLVEETISLLHSLNRLLRATAAAHADFSDISMAQVRALSHLYETGQCSIGELASGLGVTLPSASELVDRLFEAGWVERHACPNDRRKTNVSLTANALAVGDRVRATRRAQIQSAFARLDAAEQTTFVRGLNALVDAFSEPLVLEQHECARR